MPSFKYRLRTVSVTSEMESEKFSTSPAGVEVVVLQEDLPIQAAELQDVLGGFLIAAGVKVDTQHADEPSPIVFDKHGGGPQRPLVLRAAGVVAQEVWSW